MDGVKSPSPHSLQLFLFEATFQISLLYVCSEEHPASITFSKFIISNLIYHHYLFSNYLFTYKVFGVWAFSQSKLGASVAVACGLSSCGRVGLDSPRHMGLSTGMWDATVTRGPNHIFVLAGRLSTLDHLGSPPITIRYQLISLAYLIFLHTPIKISFKGLSCLDGSREFFKISSLPAHLFSNFIYPSSKLLKNFSLLCNISYFWSFCYTLTSNLFKQP